MAVFNPQIPDTNDPSYLGYSKPISDVKADQSMEALFKGVGDVLNLGVKAADTVVKQTLDDDIYSTMDAKRNEYTTSLKNTQQALKGKVSGVNANEPPKTDILGYADEDGDDVPTELGTLGSTLDTLGNARDNKKLRGTQYFAELAVIAKSFRDRYPGYKEYIDARVSQVTGVNPANAYVRALTTEINQSMAAANVPANKAANFLRTHFGDIPEAPMLLAGLENGTISPNTVYERAYPRLAAAAQFKANEAALKDFKGDKELKSIFAKQFVTKDAADAGIANLDTIVVASGLDKPEKIQDLLDRHQRGETTVPDEQWVKLDQLVRANRDKIAVDLWRKYNKEITPGVSIATTIGPEDTKKLIQEALLPHDTVLKSIGVKDPGTALTAVNLNKAASQDALRTILTDPSTAGVNLLMKAFNDAGGPEFATVMYRTILQSSLPKPDKDKLVAMAAKLIGQPDMRNTGVPYTMNKAVEDYSTGLTELEKKQGTGAVLDELTKIPNKILDKTTPMKDEGKLKLINATFSRANRGIISKFEDHQQMDLFERWTKPGMTAEIKRLSDIYSPKLWKDYKNWSEETFGSELLPKELGELNSIGKDPNLIVTWDTDYKQIKVYLKPLQYDPDNRQPYDISQTQFPRVQASVDRINQGLTSLAAIAKTEGTDVEAYLIRNIMANARGFDPRQARDLISSDITRAIMTGRTPPEPTTTSKPTKAKRTPSVQEFLNNPLGAP